MTRGVTRGADRNMTSSVAFAKDQGVRQVQEHKAAKEILEAWSRTMSEARPRSVKKQLQNSARGRTEVQPASAFAERSGKKDSRRSCSARRQLVWQRWRERR